LRFPERAVYAVVMQVQRLEVNFCGTNHHAAIVQQIEPAQDGFAGNAEHV
jgi:hypothetical protein